jgi:hypothetical protein
VEAVGNASTSNSVRCRSPEVKAYKLLVGGKEKVNGTQKARDPFGREERHATSNFFFAVVPVPTSEFRILEGGRGVVWPSSILGRYGNEF